MSPILGDTLRSCASNGQTVVIVSLTSGWVHRGMIGGVSHDKMLIDPRISILALYAHGK